MCVAHVSQAQYSEEQPPQRKQPQAGIVQLDAATHCANADSGALRARALVRSTACMASRDRVFTRAIATHRSGKRPQRAAAVGRGRG
eukprot:COSAG01_NODE_1401_length_10450_cov_100.148198_2_plen_87_part_00